MGAESPSFKAPDLRPTGSEKPEGMTAMGVVDTMGHPEAQEYREQSGGFFSCNLGVCLGRPARGYCCRRDRACIARSLRRAYVPASPNECAVSTELCLPRSGAAAPAGERRDDDDNAHTHTRGH